MQSSFRRTRRSNAIDVLWNEVGFFLRAFRNLRNPSFYPRASCLFAFHRPLSLPLPLSFFFFLSLVFSLLYTLFLLSLSLFLSFPSIVSYLAKWMKKFPPCFPSMPFEILRPIALQWDAIVKRLYSATAKRFRVSCVADWFDIFTANRIFARVRQKVSP